MMMMTMMSCICIYLFIYLSIYLFSVYKNNKTRELYKACIDIYKITKYDMCVPIYTTQLFYR